MFVIGGLITDSPIQKEEGEDSREISGRCVRRQIEHKENNDAASRWDQVIQLQKKQERS